MRGIRLLVLFLFNVLVLNLSVFSVYAKAPTTAKILFTSARDGNYEVYSMNPDGSEQVNLTQHRANDLRAVWSPTGELILFVSDRGGKRDLYLMDPDGANVRRFFNLKTADPRNMPRWSPGGKQIAYMYTRWDHREFPIYIANFGGEEEEIIMNGVHPAWSPDGTEIACIVNGRITLINIRTRKQKQPIPKKVMHWQLQPDWSATGDKLAFSGNKNPLPPDRKPGDDLPPGWVDRQTIYTVNRDGTNLRQHVDEAGPKAQHPELSPNGEEILYTQEINGKHQISKLDLSSGIRTQLTHIGFPRFGNFGGDWFDPAYALSVSPQPQLLTTIWGALKRE